MEMDPLKLFFLHFLWNMRKLWKIQSLPNQAQIHFKSYYDKLLFVVVLIFVLLNYILKCLCNYQILFYIYFKYKYKILNNLTIKLKTSTP